MENLTPTAGKSREEWRAENKDALAKIGEDKVLVESSGHNLVPPKDLSPEELEAIREGKKDLIS